VRVAVDEILLLPEPRLDDFDVAAGAEATGEQRHSTPARSACERPSKKKKNCKLQIADCKLQIAKRCQRAAGFSPAVRRGGTTFAQ